jgi:DNA-binding CsgD family transcriptional regulator
MLANIKPGKPARLAGAITTPYISALIEAKRRGAPLEPVMTRIMRELGFDSFMYAMSANALPHRRDNKAYVWTTLPLAWVRRYGQMGYLEIDPRITETYNRNVPLVWDAHDYRDDPTRAPFFHEAAQYGICSGVSISFRDPDHGRVLCAFNSAISPLDPPRRRRVGNGLGDLMFFSASFHDFFMAHFVDLGETLRTSISPLSRREKQCLELAANGMTSVDIGAKLGIKQRTANFHFNNLIQKMGVLNRQEAIAVGIARGWVRVERASLTAGCRPAGALPGASGTRNR